MPQLYTTANSVWIFWNFYVNFAYNSQEINNETVFKDPNKTVFFWIIYADDAWMTAIPTPIYPQVEISYG